MGASFPPGEWYAGLQKPAGTPPDAVFGPVWTVLYACIGVAGARVWLRAGAGLPIALWVLQLALNATWSWLFFGLHRPGLALAEICALWLAIGATALAFRPVSRAAAWLLVPYLLWVGYAARLNWGIWQLNG